MNGVVETYKDWHEMLPFALHGYKNFSAYFYWLTLHCQKGLLMRSLILTIMDGDDLLMSMNSDIVKKYYA